MGDVTICVATFGDASWSELAERRAVPSAAAQAPVVRVHGETLHEARNEALDRVATRWVVFLDADDELAPGYIDHLLAGTADLRAPAVSYIRGDRVHTARMPRVAGHHHECTAECLPDGNWLVVGTLARAQLLRDVGGWEPWPIYEDWALWLRCRRAGASIEAIPAAIYRAHVRGDSRNRSPEMHVKNRVHADIVQAVLGQDAREAA